MHAAIERSLTDSGKSDHSERCYEVLRQNLSRISAKMENFLIFEEKSHSGDNTKILKKKSRPTDSVSPSLCLQNGALYEHIYGKSYMYTWHSSLPF